MYKHCVCLCIHISVEFTQTGVECFFDNRRLAAWADVLFLCCLPPHLPKVCADLNSHLSKRCLVYSFTSAVPVTRYHHTHAQTSLLFAKFYFLNPSVLVLYFRLAQLLGHNFIIKPQYEFVACDTADVWLSCTRLTAALMDPRLIEASCPLTMSCMSWFITSTSFSELAFVLVLLFSI